MTKLLKKDILIVSLFIAIACVLVQGSFASQGFAEEYELGSVDTLSAQGDTYTLDVQGDSSTVKAAKKAVGADSNSKTYVVKTMNELTNMLRIAGYDATPSNPIFVNVKNGTYKVRTGDSILIPSNVIMVCEPKANFIVTQSRDTVVLVNGSLYGGSFNGAKKSYNVIKMGEINFSGFNGIVRNVTAYNSNKNALTIRGEDCRYSKVINCTFYGCYENGVTVEKDAQCDLIYGVKSYNNGHVKPRVSGAGINVSHADVEKIKKCNVYNNKDKGISTNSDPVAGYVQPGCTIKYVENCKFTNNGVNGVYVKPKCKILYFRNNTLKNNNDGLTVSGRTAGGTTGAAYVKNINNNTFSGSTLGQVTAGDKGAIVYLGSNNKIINGKANGCFVKNAGKLIISGNNNIISNNKGAGISIVEKGVMTSMGKDLKIAKNKNNGVYVRGASFSFDPKGSAFVYNNKGCGIYLLNMVKGNARGVQIYDNTAAQIFVRSGRGL